MCTSIFGLVTLVTGHIATTAADVARAL